MPDAIEENTERAKPSPSPQMNIFPDMSGPLRTDLVQSKESESPNLYQAGEQNFSVRSLRGENFSA